MEFKSIKYKRENSSITPPQEPREGDVGFDLCSAEDCELIAGQCSLISTGVSLSIPCGYFGQIRDRSSKSKNYHVLAGVIDASYTGIVKCRVLCHSATQIKKGDKIAQMIIEHDLSSEFYLQEVSELEPTERGDNGFGSTGA